MTKMCLGWSSDKASMGLGKWTEAQENDSVDEQKSCCPAKVGSFF